MRIWAEHTFSYSKMFFLSKQLIVKVQRPLISGLWMLIELINIGNKNDNDTYVVLHIYAFVGIHEEPVVIYLSY